MNVINCCSHVTFTFLIADSLNKIGAVNDYFSEKPYQLNIRSIVSEILIENENQ